MFCPQFGLLGPCSFLHTQSGLMFCPQFGLLGPCSLLHTQSGLMLGPQFGLLGPQFCLLGPSSHLLVGGEDVIMIHLVIRQPVERGPIIEIRDPEPEPGQHRGPDNPVLRQADGHIHAPSVQTVKDRLYAPRINDVILLHAGSGVLIPLLNRVPSYLPG